MTNFENASYSSFFPYRRELHLKAPAQVAFAPNNRVAYVTLRDENAVARIDVATRKVLGKVAVGPGPIQLTVTPDNRFVLVANQGTPERPGTTLDRKSVV